MTTLDLMLQQQLLKQF